jgi:hypothetical protein
LLQRAQVSGREGMLNRNWVLPGWLGRLMGILQGGMTL